MKYFLFISILGSICCHSKLASEKLLKVPYGRDPETPKQSLLDSLAILRMDSLEIIEVEVLPDRKQHFYQFHQKPFSGWVKEDFKETHQRIRYYQIDSGFVNWQIGYFDNGQLDCDFHSLKGLNHGNQRMWSRDGTPYINTNSIMDKKHGIQKRWHPNGELNWLAEYDSGKLVYEISYTPKGKIKKFDGDFTLPIPDETQYEKIKSLSAKWQGPFGAYLDYFFETDGDKKPLKTEGEHACHYEVSFAEKLKINIDQCRSISNTSIMTLPRITDSEAKKLLYTIVRPWDESDTYRWSKDTLYFTEDGIPESAGCNVEIEHTSSTTIIKLFCTE